MLSKINSKEIKSKLCIYCKKECTVSALPSFLCHRKCLINKRKHWSDIGYKKAKNLFSNKKCTICNSLFKIQITHYYDEWLVPKYLTIHNFDDHHLVYPSEGKEVKVILCKNCHGLLHSNGYGLDSTPSKRIKVYWDLYINVNGGIN